MKNNKLIFVEIKIYIFLDKEFISFASNFSMCSLFVKLLV